MSTRARRVLVGRGAATAAALLVLMFTSETLVAPRVTSAQSTLVGVGVTVEPEFITVGDVFSIRVSANHPPDHHVVFPDIPANWGDFEVRKVVPIGATANDDGTLTSSILIEVTAFEPGTHPTPALSVAVRRPDGGMINRSARRVEVEVQSVLAGPDEVLRDIKPQAKIAVPLVAALVDRADRVTAIVAGALAAAVLVGGLVWWRFARRPDSEGLSATEIALRELDLIARLDLPSRGLFKEHYDRVTSCLRDFLWGRFKLPARELTTGQTVAELDGAGFPGAEMRDLAGILEEADLVKFARLRPDPQEAREIVPASQEVVTGLGPESGEAADESDGDSADAHGSQMQ